MEKLLLLADDQMIVREGLHSFLSKNFRFKEVDHAESCTEIRMRLQEKAYTHLVTEISFQDGTIASIIPIIHQSFPKLKTLIFTSTSESLLKAPLASFEIRHIISKKAPAVQALRHFDRFFNEESVRKTIFRPIDKTSTFLDLTPRQFEIYSRILENKSTSEIAKELNLAQSTVSTVKHRLFEKSNAGSVEDLRLLQELAKISKTRNKTE